MKHSAVSRAAHRARRKVPLGACRGSYAAARLGILIGTAAAALALVTSITCASPAAPSGEATEDIIDGCNQFIKFARKGYSRQDPDTMRHLGECLGAVRTMLATEIAADAICPTENTKLIDAVTAFSLYLIQHLSDLKTFYVLPLRQALRAAYPCSAIRQ
jgi:hypothetical protein